MSKKQSALARRLAAKEAQILASKDTALQQELVKTNLNVYNNLESTNYRLTETNNTLKYNLDTSISDSLATKVNNITDIANPLSLESRLTTAEGTILTLTADKAPASHTHPLNQIVGYYDDKVSELTLPVVRDDFIAQSNETGEAGEAKPCSGNKVVSESKTKLWRD